MRHVWMLWLALGVLALTASAALAQPPRDRDQRGGPPPRPFGPGPHESGPREGGPWEPGKIVPPHVIERLKLTAEQRKQLIDLETEVKDKILKLLTDEQKQQLETMKPSGPPDDQPPPPPRFRRGSPRGDGPARGEFRPGPGDDRGPPPPRRGRRPGPPDEREDEPDRDDA